MALFGLGGGTTQTPSPPPEEEITEPEPIQIENQPEPTPSPPSPGPTSFPFSAGEDTGLNVTPGGQYQHPGYSDEIGAATLGDLGGAQGLPDEQPVGFIPDPDSDVWTYLQSQYSGGGSSGDGGGGGPTPAPPPDLAWEETFQVEGAPEWWRGMTPNRLTPTTEIATLINNMIPFMSPEDQRTAGQNLARMFEEPFGRYDPQIQDFPVPPEIGSGTEFRERFESRDRAERAITALSDMAQSINRTPEDFGPGFQFLQQLLDVERDFGGGGDFIPDDQQPQEFQTRAERRSERAALDPLLAETEGRALQAFGPLARMLTDPFFSAGDISPSVETRAGNRIPGVPNPELFT